MTLAKTGINVSLISISSYVEVPVVLIVLDTSILLFLLGFLALNLLSLWALAENIPYRDKKPGLRLVGEIISVGR